MSGGDGSLDRLPSEQPNPRTADLDRLDALGILQRINAEDRTVALAVAAALPDLARAVDLAQARWARGGRVVLFGAGTSGRLAVLDAAELPPTFGVSNTRYLARLAGGSAAIQAAVEGAEDDAEAGRGAARDLGPDDVAFGVAASGRTPWVLGALTAARERAAATIGLACVPSPRLGKVVDVCVVVDTGPEVVAGSTRMKAGTAQKMVLNAFSTALMVRLGRVYGNLMVDVRASNDKLRVRAVRLVRAITAADDEPARHALIQAEWDVKVAVAMLHLRVEASQARQRLHEVDGRLRSLLRED